MKRGIEEAAGEYNAAIHLLEQKRARLTDRLVAASSLAYHPDAGPMPNVQQIPQPEEYADQPPLQWSHVRAHLHRDAEHLPTTSAVRVDHAKILDESIDRHRGFVAKESGRHRWFRRGTEAYLDVRDRIAQIKAETRNNDLA